METYRISIPAEAESIRCRESYDQSFNLLWYLLKDPEQIANFEELPSELHFGLVTPFLRELSESRSDVYVHSEEDRALFKKSTDVTAVHPVLRAYFEEQQAFYAQEAERMDAAERSRTIYFDLADQSIGATPIVHGKYDSVTSEYGVLLNSADSKFPIIPVHTHPFDTSFSGTDLRSLIAKYVDTRLVQGTLVICPNLQLFALASDQTPIMDPDKVEDFMDKKVSEIYSQARGDLIWKQLDHAYIDQYVVVPSILARIYDEYHLEMEDIASKVDRQEIDERTGELLKDESEKELWEYATSYEKKANRRYKNRMNRFLQLRNQADARITIQLARSLNIKLYSSTDMENFKEFSA